MAGTEHALAGRVACVDLETTGGHAARDRIIEAGIVLLEDGQVVEEYSTLVNPGARIPYAIQQFTGITEAMVADAPPFEAVADEIESRLAGRLFVAHNARFDYGFLRNEFRRIERRFRAPVLCTVRLSRAMTPDERGHSLDAVMHRHGIACDARHRALGDAKVLADFLRIARKRLPAEELDPIVKKLTGTSRLPPQLDPALADELPEAPGVYLFYGEDGGLLYVGKAKNLANRVTSHFANARAKLEQQLTRLVHRIEWIETAGRVRRARDGGAPHQGEEAVFNRKLRGSSELWAIALRDDSAMPLARIAMLDTLDDPGASYGMFRRRTDAERALEGLAREHQLCAKWLGIEESEGSCIGLQLGRCRGVCIGKELPALHAVRARLALSGLKRRDWPFAGPIGIRERDWRGVEATHVFDRWCYRDEPFDLDIYRILTGFLDRPVRGAEILKPGKP